MGVTKSFDAVGLDAGSNWTRCVICQLEGDRIRFRGYGQAVSHGWSKGRIVDQNAASQSILTALQEAEKDAQVSVESVVLGVGANVRGANCRGFLDLGRLREFLMSRMYRYWKVNRTRSQARRILAEMFQLFMAEPDVLPTEWFARSQNRDEAGRARVVCDYIAGMTDRFAIEEHRKLFDPFERG